MTALMNTYNRQPVGFTHGQGVWMWDAQGRRYLDGLSGIAVNTLGHNHPRFVAGLRDQVGRLIHTSNLYEVPLQSQLADTLIRLSGMTNVFFCNSGLEANETALKLARKYGHKLGFAAPKTIVFERAFHGRSLATLSATGNEKVQKGFEPLVEGFVRVPLNDIAAITQAAQAHPEISAVFLETIQGEGGIRPSHIEFLQSLRQLCTEKKWLFMLDEVQCGIGRTGKWFAHQWAGVIPDVMPLAKGLGSGVPIGAVVAHGPAAEVFEPGNHGTTFGGNPLAMRAGLETIAAIESEGLLENAAARGRQLLDGFRASLANCQGIREIRGQGLMIGIELDRPCGELVGQAREAGLLINVTADSVIRLLPALILNPSEAQQMVSILAPIIRQFLGARPA
ncbi:MAG: aspartate aminotransferase family protein [Betaproteobacteria bacterium]|nr:aspartate aminotransferase family protein [Betaproteobacteria bacterium]